MNKIIRILLVDDHELLRQGLRHMLESEEDMIVVGDCADVEEAFSKVARFDPDIVLMDIQMSGINGIEATRILKSNVLDYGGDIIILAESVDYQAEALEAGAVGYLLKDGTYEELAQAIREVHRNRYSLEERDSLVEEVVELVVPPPANSAHLLRFMCQLGEMLHDDFISIVCTVGSWDYGTVITVRSRPATTSSLLIKLANVPEIEKIDEEPLAKGTFSSFPKKFGFLPRSGINPNRRIRLTQKETDLARQELATVSN